MTTVSAPSPSTRARLSTLIVLRAMAFRLLTERLTVGIEGAIETMDIAIACTELSELLRQCCGVRRLHRAVAAVAAAVVARTERTTTGMGDRPEAGRAVRDHDADITPELALDADAVRRHCRLASCQKRGNHLDQLVLVYGTAAELEIDLDVRRYRRRGGERADVVGPRIDRRHEAGDIGVVAERLNTAGRGTGADRDQGPRSPSHLADAFHVMGRGHRALDQRQIIGAGDL